MSAAGQVPDPDSIQAAALQARLDQLFRHHVRDDPAASATGVLRSYVERYRLPAAVQAGEAS